MTHPIRLRRTTKKKNAKHLQLTSDSWSQSLGSGWWRGGDNY